MFQIPVTSSTPKAGHATWLNRRAAARGISAPRRSTGIWNIAAVRSQIHGSYRTTLIVKLVVVAISGVTALLHARARTPAGQAVFGALTGLSALAALFLGVLLAG